MPSDILALEIVVHGWPWVILWLESTWRCVLWSSLVVDKRASSIQFSFICVFLVDMSPKLILDSGLAVQQLVTLWIRTSLLCFYFCLLYNATVLLKFTYYAQYYAQEQELWSEYYAILIQVFMNKFLLKDCFIRVHL